jgi:hypothetical protein
VKPVRRRELAGWFQVTFQVSRVRACRLAHSSRAAWYRRSRARDQSALRLRIRELAHARPRFGYLRIWVLLRREGWAVNRSGSAGWRRDTEATKLNELLSGESVDDAVRVAARSD